MENEILIEEYKALYKKIRELVLNEDTFPLIKDEDYKKLISREDWIGVPSFGMDLDDMIMQGMPHISFGGLSKGELRANIIFNGKNGVEKFLNIIHPILKTNETRFIDLAKDLGKNYSIKLRYFEGPHPATAPTNRWIEKGIWNCAELKDLEIIESVYEKTNSLCLFKNKMWGQKNNEGETVYPKISVGVSITNLDKNNSFILTEVFTKFGNILERLHKTKPEKELKNKISKEEHENTLKKLREQGIKI